ncbi:hypothetical protein FRC08_009271 [Ceratobasidium sp. 394]|nr:hypothetical protein FRC08_009271 [Ceratobasidium sp. 394]
MPLANPFFSRIQSAPVASDDDQDPFAPQSQSVVPPPPSTPSTTDSTPQVPPVLHFGHARTQSNLSSTAYTDIPEHTDNESESSVTSVSTPPSALAQPSPTKERFGAASPALRKPPPAMDSDEEIESMIPSASASTSFGGNTTLRASASVPSIGKSAGLGFGYGALPDSVRRAGVDKGKARLLDSLDLLDHSSCF